MSDGGDGAARGHAVVIGAGIVGMASALWLRRDGWRVTVCDARAPGEGCSFGNAGVIGVVQVVPPFTAALLAEVPRMLLDRHWSVSIRLAYLPRLAPWLVRFLAASTPKRIADTAAALAGLLGASMDSHRALLEMADAEHLLKRQGWLAVYKRATPSLARALALRRRHGARAEELGGPEIRQLAPALARDLDYGVFYPDVGHVLDPFAVVQAYARHHLADGGEIVRSNVTGFVTADRHVRAVRTQDGEIACDLVVLAAGAWSRDLSRALGARVPLDTERGYHVSLPEPGIELPLPVMAGDVRFGVTPMTPGLRIAGNAEFAGLDAPPDPRRHDVMLAQAEALLPGLKTEPRTTWMGCRPSTPDSVPVIGRAPHADNAYLAFGHGHLGLTMGPATGRAIADLAAGRAPAFDVTPFRADRFR